MKIKSFMVKQMLMSTVTAAMFVTTFTACSDEVGSELQAPAVFGEVITGCGVALNTPIYVNPDANAITRSGASMAEKYTVNRSVVTP